MPRAFLVKRFGAAKERDEKGNDISDLQDFTDVPKYISENKSKVQPPVLFSSAMIQNNRDDLIAKTHDVGTFLSNIVLRDYQAQRNISPSESEGDSLEDEKYHLMRLESESNSSVFSETSTSSALYPVEDVEASCFDWEEHLGKDAKKRMQSILQQRKNGFLDHNLNTSQLTGSFIDQANDMIEDVKPQFQCNQCEKTFKTRYTLNIHRKMPSHTTLKPFVCPTCGKGFRLSSTLCRHKIIHTSQRPHRCHVCQKSFNRSSTLKTHLRTHSNVKEFTCEMCGKGFHQKGNLRNHVLIHTGEKPYQCSVCKKTFNKLSNLKFHMHSHTDQKPYRCRYCKHSFCKRGELKQHIAHCRHSGGSVD